MEEEVEETRALTRAEEDFYMKTAETQAQIGMYSSQLLTSQQPQKPASKSINQPVLKLTFPPPSLQPRTRPPHLSNRAARKSPHDRNPPTHPKAAAPLRQTKHPAPNLFPPPHLRPAHAHARIDPAIDPPPGPPDPLHEQ